MKVWLYFLKFDAASMRLTWVSAMSPVYLKSGAVWLHTVGKDHTSSQVFFCGTGQEPRGKLHPFVISALSQQKYQVAGIHYLFKTHL